MAEMTQKLKFLTNGGQQFSCNIYTDPSDTNNEYICVSVGGTKGYVAIGDTNESTATPMRVKKSNGSIKAVLTSIPTVDSAGFSFLSYSDGSCKISTPELQCPMHKTYEAINLSSIKSISYPTSTSANVEFVCPSNVTKLVICFSWHSGGDESSTIASAKVSVNGREVYANTKHNGYSIVGDSNPTSVVSVTPNKKYTLSISFDGDNYKGRNYGLNILYGTNYNDFRADISAD